MLAIGDREVAVRMWGPPDAPAVLVLHGGWGAGFYDFDAVAAALAIDHRVVLFDRTGYGGSGRRAVFARPFHAWAADEAEAVIAALGLVRPALWGHSDGAVIALQLALRTPAAYRALVLEALHVDREKPSSRRFFTDMLENPAAFGPRVAARLAAEHGDPDWRAILAAGGQVWLDLATQPGDLYAGHAPDLTVPTLLLHGAADPRTEPGELDAIRALPCVEDATLASAGHSPHSERAHAADAIARAAAFLRRHRR